MSDILKNYPLDKVRIRNINKIKMEHPVSFEYIKKQGALEELKKIYKDIDVLWSRVNLDLMTASKIKDILYNRIKELEKEGVEQK